MPWCWLPLTSTKTRTTCRSLWTPSRGLHEHSRQQDHHHHHHQQKQKQEQPSSKSRSRRPGDAEQQQQQQQQSRSILRIILLYYFEVLDVACGSTRLRYSGIIV